MPSSCSSDKCLPRPTGCVPCPNVHLLGRKPYADLPAYCAAFDVAILPFKQNEFTRYINPIKLREYLAAGLPVVSTPIPEAEIFVPEVALATNAETFAQACQEAVSRSSIDKRVRRSRTMTSHTWDAVVAKLGAIVMGQRERPSPGPNDSKRPGRSHLPFHAPPSESSNDGTTATAARVN